MDDFDFSFEEEKEGTFEKDYTETTFEKKSDNTPSKNSWRSKDNNNWKKKKRLNEIDLFKKEPVPAEPLDLDKLKVGKVVTIVFPDKNFEITDEEKKKFWNILKLLDMANYRVRFLCNTVNPILDILPKAIDEDKVEVVKPWDKFCKSGKYKKLFPTDDNIKTASYYYPKFDKLPTAVKFINSALMTVLLGPKNDDALEMAIVYDPYYDGKKIDFSKSKDTAFWYWFPKKLKDVGVSVYNLAKDEDYYSLVKLLK